jgi:hypothetical protein
MVGYAFLFLTGSRFLWMMVQIWEPIILLGWILEDCGTEAAKGSVEGSFEESIVFSLGKLSSPVKTAFRRLSSGL